MTALPQTYSQHTAKCNHFWRWASYGLNPGKLSIAGQSGIKSAYFLYQYPTPYSPKAPPNIQKSACALKGLTTKAPTKPSHQPKSP
jgi:hypothetical protein